MKGTKEMKKRFGRWVVGALLVVMVQAAPCLAFMDLAACMAQANWMGRGVTTQTLTCNGFINELDGIEYHIIPRTSVAAAGWAAAVAGTGRATIVGHIGGTSSPCGVLVPTIFACKVTPI